MEMKTIDLREAIACINYLKQGHNGIRKYEIGIVTERISGICSSIEVGVVVVFYKTQEEDSLVLAQPDMKSILKTKNTIVGVPPKFITRIVLE